MRRRIFLKGVGGLLSGLVGSRFIKESQREPEPQPDVEPPSRTNDWVEQVPETLWVSSGSTGLGYYSTPVYEMGNPSPIGVVSSWGINPLRPRCHYCNAYQVRGRETCPKCGGEYREMKEFDWE